jgi:hypothetical protein
MEKRLEGGSKLLGFTIRQRCAIPSSLLRNQKHVEVIATKHRRPVMSRRVRRRFAAFVAPFFKGHHRVVSYYRPFFSGNLSTAVRQLLSRQSGYSRGSAWRSLKFPHPETMLGGTEGA